MYIHIYSYIYVYVYIHVSDFVDMTLIFNAYFERQTNKFFGFNRPSTVLYVKQGDTTSRYSNTYT